MARCLQSPYRLLQLPGEVQVELPLPFWVDPAEDLAVTISDASLTVTVDGVMTLRRVYYRNAAQEAKQGPGSYKVCLGCVQRVDWLCAEAPQQPLRSACPQAGAMSCPSQVVDVAASSWCLLDQEVQQQQQPAPASSSSSSPVPSRRKAGKLLSISLVLPESTQEEVQYKMGGWRWWWRQHARVSEQPGSSSHSDVHTPLPSNAQASARTTQ
jgi:hypothetical protein